MERRGTSGRAVRKPAILAVDDKPANLLALEVLLGFDHVVHSVTSGEQAIELLRRTPGIDVVILDIQMPGMDGFDTALAIKQIPGCEDIPIVFVTAVYQDDPYMKKGYAVGGVDYFGKPFDPEILKMKIAIYASFRRKADLLRQRELHVEQSEELLRVGRKLSGLLESLPVGVLIADLDGRICQGTEEVSRILESTEAAQSGNYGEFLGWWDSAGVLIKEGGPLSRALRGETAPSEPIQIRSFQGAEKTIHVSAAPLHGLDQRVVGAVVLLQDLTQKKSIEKDLQDRVTRIIGLGVELEESVAR
jgi:CheY-like chemotaxis protein